MEILTDNQVKAIAESRCQSWVFPEDNWEDGWKQCTEYYRELLEAGKKWNELFKVIDNLDKDKGEQEYWKQEEIELISDYALKIAEKL